MTLPAKTTSKALALLESNLATFGEIPLAEAQNFDDETLHAAVQFVGFAEDYADPLRYAVGASLTARRDGASRGEWGPWLKDFAEQFGRSSASMTRWMREAQAHYNTKPPKGAHKRPGENVHDAHFRLANRSAVALTKSPIPILAELGLPALRNLQGRINEAIRAAPRTAPVAKTAAKTAAKPIDTTGREVTAHFKKGKR